jgi:hypothetical protein
LANWRATRPPSIATPISSGARNQGDVSPPAATQETAKNGRNVPPNASGTALKSNPMAGEGADLCP